jgi:hypothetical protein
MIAGGIKSRSQLWRNLGSAIKAQSSSPTPEIFLDPIERRRSYPGGGNRSLVRSTQMQHKQRRGCRACLIGQSRGVQFWSRSPADESLRGINTTPTHFPYFFGVNALPPHSIGGMVRTQPGARNRNASGYHDWGVSAAMILLRSGSIRVPCGVACLMALLCPHVPMDACAARACLRAELAFLRCCSCSALRRSR